MKFGYHWSGRVLGSLLSVAIATHIANAQQHEASKGRIQWADPNIRGDGLISPAAAAAMQRGPLLMNEADAAAKQAATRASEKYEQSAPAAAPSAEVSEIAPLLTVVDDHSFAGQAGAHSYAPVSTGAIGPFSYIQMTKTSARIYNRSTHVTVATATLDDFAGNTATSNPPDPQIMWDPSTNRFYYVMYSDSVSDYQLAFGFSRTSNPTDFSTNNWCKYVLNFGDRAPISPKLALQP